MTGPSGANPTIARTRPHATDLSSFWELALDILALVTPDGTFLHVNPAFTRVLGWPREEVVGRTAFDFLHPADVDRTADAFEDIAGPGHLVADFENRYLARDGSYRTLRWNARTSMDGRVIHAVARDMTTEQERLDALRLSEERFRLSMQSAAIGMAIVGLDSRFVEVNDALCRLVGRPRDVLTTLTFPDITHPDDVDADVALAGRLLAGDIDHYDLEKRYLHADGSIVWVQLTGSVVRDRAGQPQHFIAQVQDISVRKRAQADLARTLRDLQQSNETLAEFAAVAAHDLKAPLAVAISTLDVVLLRYAAGLAPQGVDLLQRGLVQLRRLGHQVDGLLRIAAVSGRALDLERVDVAEAVEGVRGLLPDDLGELEVTVDASHSVQVDRAAIGLLLQNVLANAAMHGGRHVRVGSHLEGSWVRVEVDDDGPGVPEDDRDHVFEVFGRSGDGRRSTGLGLALCRRIVDRHGGTIGIGTSPAGGARVWFTLPHDSAPAGGEETGVDGSIRFA